LVPVFALWQFLVACGSDDESPRGTNTGGIGGTGGTTLSGDALTIDKAIAGEISAEQAFDQIALSDGFPIEVDGGFLFARLDDGGGAYELAGDFNAWSPQPMSTAPGFYYAIVNVSAPDGAKYKLVRGGEFAPDPYARRYAYDELGEISLVRAGAPHLERFPKVAGASVPARSVRVWVPGSSATHHLYVHDGQNLFDPQGPFGGWHLNDAVGSSTLVVGIDNGGALRIDEYTHVPDVIDGTNSVGGKGDAYADYVLETVRPLVESRHGVPTRAGVLGASLGGLISFHQALKNPDAWQFAGSMSGTFGWGSIGATNETLIERWQASPKLDTTLYLDSGGGPGAGCVDSDGDGIEDDAAGSADNYCETVQLRDVLESSGYLFDQDLFHWHEPGATHDEAAWAARVFRPVQIFEAL
jgi:hypothetical protein